jgi:hypothetical protein
MTSLFADTLPSMPQLESLILRLRQCSYVFGVICKVREHHMPHLQSVAWRWSEEQCAMVNSIACQNLFQQAVNALIADYVAGCITSARSRLL